MIVETAHGRVLGRELNGVREFFGIPYAGSVAGPARFLPAPPPEPWDGVREAFTFPPPAPQPIGVPPSTSSNEQHCLGVNVWAGAAPGSRRPVLVNIHGGGFTFGSGDAAPLPPALVREHELVVVTFNYRLGALGFLHLAEIAGEGYELSGNAGLVDQVDALRWVRENIGAFGGDPDDVTIAGQSAGAVSVGDLLVIPKAHDLFRRAVAEYGPVGHGSTPSAATALAHRFLDRLGIRPDSWKELLDVPVAALLQAQSSVGDPMGIFRGEKLWAPIVDGRFLPTSPLQGMGERNTGKPLIVGCDHDHFASLMGSGDRFTLRDGEDPFTTWLRPTLGERTEQIASHLAATTPDESPAQRVARALGELFRGGIIDMAEAWAASGNPVWVYLAMPTQHWGVPPRRLAQFVATGEPNGPGDVHWPAYSVSDRRTLVVDASERIEVDPGGVDRAVFGGVGFGA